MTRLSHDHQLDGTLHDGDGCAMCVEIRTRWERAKIDTATARSLSQYEDVARRETRLREEREP